MSTYNLNIDTVNTSLGFYQAEKHIFGSSRLGMLKDSVNVLGSAYGNTDSSNVIHTLGNKRYELSNHLGNVLTVITDKPIPHNNGGTVDYWEANISFAYDYSPFGVLLTGRTFEGKQTVCHDSTVNEVQFALQETFDIDSTWTSVNSATLIYSATYFSVPTILTVSNASFSKRNIGAKKTFTTGTGAHDVSFAIPIISCVNTVVWPYSSTQVPVKVSVKDNLGNVVTTGNYLTAGSYNLSFTPASAGATYTIEFLATNVNPISNFQLDDVLISFDDATTLTVCKEVGDGYRYGFGGQEKDDEVSGKGNSYTAQFWQYDSRLGRRWNIDPMSAKYPWQSPYATFNNNPIFFIDPLGLEGTNTTGEKEPKKESRKEKKERRQKMFGSKDDGVDLDEVQILPPSPSPLPTQEKSKSKGYEWMSGASMKNFFGNGPSLGSEGKGVYYTDKTNRYYEDWMKGREKHKALEKFFMFYAGGSLAAPFAIAGAVTTAPVWTPYLAMGANGSVRVAKAYHVTFGMKGGYANMLVDAGLQNLAKNGQFNYYSFIGSGFIPGNNYRTIAAFEMSTAFINVNKVDGVSIKAPTANTVFDLTTSVMWRVWGVSKYGDPTVGLILDGTIKGSAGKVREEIKDK